tara:strand:+ start:21 stop:218 length:198 start_codon:yes stop_codon:yes gene_type:complete
MGEVMSKLIHTDKKLQKVLNKINNIKPTIDNCSELYELMHKANVIRYEKHLKTKKIKKQNGRAND